LIFRQIKQNGDNFSYIMGDETSHEAAVVDPSFNASAILKFVKDKALDVKYVIVTHYHPDHLGESYALKEELGSKIVAHKQSWVEKDVGVDDGEVIRVGQLDIQVIHTPGHTPDSICLLFDKIVLTGDTLFVGECGRTDTPDGDPKSMYYSLSKLTKLDDDVFVYPGHDYGPKPYSTIGEEKRANYTLEKRTLEEFIEFMRTP